MNKFLIQIAIFFGAGKSPKAPGTVGTIATIPLWYALSHLGPIAYMAITFALVFVGVAAANAYEAVSQKHDSQEIVIDEVVGFLITMTWLPVTWQSLLIGFAVFRILDILKPPPIRQLDRKVQGGFGVMVDDIAAGIIGSIIMQIIYNQTNWLGMQISTLTPG
ncbi:MAG: phosphatidylglycerophosphatase [Pseudobdellovibrio sp.]|jgi:phosphatidylglycerophosphatase A|nr:phosphatidylglycerophosphatase [Pseudobdellovibrio sp.]